MSDCCGNGYFSVFDLQRKTFALLISLCMMFMECICRSPCTVSMRTRHTWDSRKNNFCFLRSVIISRRSPLSALSITMLHESARSALTTAIDSSRRRKPLDTK